MPAAIGALISVFQQAPVQRKICALLVDGLPAAGTVPANRRSSAATTKLSDTCKPSTPAGGLTSSHSSPAVSVGFRHGASVGIVPPPAPLPSRDAIPLPAPPPAAIMPG